MQTKSGQEDGMLQAVNNFCSLPRSLMVNLSSYDNLYFDVPHNYDLFCENRSIRFSRLCEKNTKF